MRKCLYKSAFMELEKQKRWRNQGLTLLHKDVFLCLLAALSHLGLQRL